MSDAHEMSAQPGATPRPRQEPQPRDDGGEYIRGLGWLCGLGWGLAVVLSVIGLSMSTYSVSDLERQAGLYAWADIFLLLAISSTVGLIVLSGVRAMIHGPRE